MRRELWSFARHARTILVRVPRDSLNERFRYGEVASTEEQGGVGGVGACARDIVVKEDFDRVDFLLHLAHERQHSAASRTLHSPTGHALDFRTCCAVLDQWTEKGVI